MSFTVKTPTGRRVRVEADTAFIGKDASCQIALPDEPDLQPIHARIRKVANRWMIESQGDWQLQVGGGSLGRMSWLMPGDVIRLTARGTELVFEPGVSVESVNGRDDATSPAPAAPVVSAPKAAPPTSEKKGHGGPPPLPSSKKPSGPPPLPSFQKSSGPPPLPKGKSGPPPLPKGKSGPPPLPAQGGFVDTDDDEITLDDEE